MRTRIATFFKSIKGKILLYIGSTVVFMTVALIAFFGTRGYRNLWKAHEDLIVENATSAALSIDKENYDLISVAKTMAESQESGLFGQRVASINYVKRVLLGNLHTFTATFLAYEPNADQNDEAFLRQAGVNSEAVDEHGRFLPRWFRNKDDPNLIQLQPFDYPDTSQVYLGVKDNFKADAENPCLITEAHAHLGKIVVEGVCPIASGNQFVGVAGVARTVTSFREGLQALETPYQTSDFFLL